MNKTDFINAVNEKYKQTKSDKLLIPEMSKIVDYYKSLESQLDASNDIKLTIGFDVNTANLVNVELDSNQIKISRLDDSISMSFVSSKDNEYSEKYQHLDLNTLSIDSEENVINADGSIFTTDILDNYLKYLLV